MRVFAFQGIRYRRPADPAALAAPPFDQIGESLRERLHETPHQFSQLTRPVPAEGEDRYQRAATLHSSWLEEGVAAPDREPSLYPYVIRLPGGGQRLGLCALVGVEEPGRGVIRPHERTVAKAIEDRLSLLRATRVDLEPILLLSEDGGELDRLLARDLAGREALAGYRDQAGNEHLLHRIADAERIGEYQELLRPISGLIADGHHRYKVAWTYARENDLEGADPAAAKLAVITSLASPALSIDPIHRALAGKPDLAPLDPLIRSRLRWRGRSGAELADRVARSPQPAMACRRSGEEAEIWLLDPETAPEEVSPGAAALTVVLLHQVLFAALELPDSAATDGTVTYRSDPEELFQEVERGDHGAGFWLPPMEAGAFARAIADGGLLPPKSTRFLPKVASGLVWSAHDGEIR